MTQLAEPTLSAQRAPNGYSLRQPRGPRRFPYRLTFAGFTYLMVTSFVLIATINSGTNLLYFVFGVMAGAILISFFFSAWSLRRIAVDRTFAEHVVAGESAEIEYTLTNRKRLTPGMALHLCERHPLLIDPPQAFILYIPAKSAVTLISQLLAARRGMILLDTVELACSFPFGFLSRVVRVRHPQELVVYPRIGMLNRKLALQYRESIETGTMTSNVRGGNDEFYGLREYRPGDNIRAIHWRTTARTSELMIREMSANAPPQLVVVLNLRTALPGEEQLVERAIEMAASLICYGFFENFAVGLAIAGEESTVPPAPTMGRDARGTLLRRLAVLDHATLQSDKGIVLPNRLAGRAEWVVVTLHASDPCHDLAPAASGGLSAGPPRSGHQTLLAMDSPDAPNWLHFLTPQDTLRLLRDRTAQ